MPVVLAQVDSWTHQLCGQRTLLRQWALDRELPARLHGSSTPLDLVEGVDRHDTTTLLTWFDQRVGPYRGAYGEATRTTIGG